MNNLVVISNGMRNLSMIIKAMSTGSTNARIMNEWYVYHGHWSLVIEIWDLALTPSPHIQHTMISYIHFTFHAFKMGVRSNS
jgi:hypothetical protein